jgi:succinate-semialdehyde dehydrogenase / glutarate-semialdehyde dehydrogenase
MTSALSALLKDPGLLVLDRTYVDGSWVVSKSGQTFEVTNPASDAVIGRLPESGLDDLNDAIQAASRALEGWKRRPGRQRARVIHKIYELLMEHQQDLATIISAENGKAKADATGEVL